MRPGPALTTIAATILSGLAAAPSATAAPPPATPVPPLPSAGPALVADIVPGAPAGDPRGLTAAAGAVFFTAVSAGHGRELWRSDGTAAGTRMVADILPGPAGSDPRELTDVNGWLFFTAVSAGHGRELWSSDGTAAGTRMVADIAPGPRGSVPRQVAYGVNTDRPGSVPRTLAYFSADDGTHGRELWRSDGTGAGTALVADLLPGSAGSQPGGFEVPPGAQGAGTTLVFAADDGVHGRELWRSDGTAAGTVLQADIAPGPAGSGPAFITGNAAFLGLFGSFPFVYLSADDGTSGREPWVSYLPGGRTSVIDLRPGAEGSNPVGFGRFPFEYAAVSADDGTHGREPYYLRPGLPTAAGAGAATLVADLNPGPAGSAPHAPVFVPAVGAGRLVSAPSIITRFARQYLSATVAGTGGPRLHKLDIETVGPFSQAGTHGISAIEPALVSAEGADPGPAVLAGGTLVYPAARAGHGRELWRSGGHASNTGPVADLRPGPAGSHPRELTVAGQRVLFTADDGVHGRELWSTAVGEGTSVSIEGPINPTSAEPSTFTLTVGAAAGAAVPTGSVTVWEGDEAVATVALPLGEAVATWTTTLAPGPHRLTATYSGDRTFAPSTSAPWLQTLP
jgi:ELWxxDGT repeat protein